MLQYPLHSMVSYTLHKEQCLNSYEFRDTHHTSSNDNRGKVLKFGSIPPDILIDGVDEVQDCCHKRHNQ